MEMRDKIQKDDRRRSRKIMYMVPKIYREVLDKYTVCSDRLSRNCGERKYPQKFSPLASVRSSTRHLDTYEG